MTHDKFCATVTKGIPGIVAFPDYLCNCEEIAAIRADEREQAAQRILTIDDKTLNDYWRDGVHEALAAARGEDAE